MQALMEKPPVVDPTELAPTPTQTSSPLPTTPTKTPPQALGSITLTTSDCGPPPADLSVWLGGHLGVPGTGEPDVDVAFRAVGPITSAEVADFLDWCAERIIRFGWVQGTEVHKDRVCAVGAIRHRSDQLSRRMAPIRADNLSTRSMYALTGWLTATYSHAISNIPSWNDTQGRTQADVVAAFRGAARHVRESEGAHA